MNVIDYFLKICEIPHASRNTKELAKWLIDECKKRNFITQIDQRGNIYAKKGEPEICIQSHYDMVKVGSENTVKVIFEDDFIKAENSSLGADDGIGVAISLKMMDEFENLEVIFTNDEEVGLWGVQNFDYKIKSDKILNLDSENDEQVCVGCAGGVDILAFCDTYRKLKKGFCYEFKTKNFPGGHSGSEIDKNLPNAIKSLAKFIRENSGSIVNFKGGERINSIPVNAMCKAVFDNEISKVPEFLEAEFFGFDEYEIYKKSAEILDFICIFSQGVRAWNNTLNIPESSANIALCEEIKGQFKISIFARAMNELENLQFETKILGERLGFKICFENFSKPWKPQINDFSHLVLKNLQKFSPNAKFYAIHAGLECGVFITKNRNLKVASIGPNIFGAHSVNEKVQISSIKKIENTVREIIKNI